MEEIIINDKQIQEIADRTAAIVLHRLKDEPNDAQYEADNGENQTEGRECILLFALWREMGYNFYRREFLQTKEEQDEKGIKHAAGSGHAAEPCRLRRAAESGRRTAKDI